jgi:hypothetical protein
VIASGVGTGYILGGRLPLIGFIRVSDIPVLIIGAIIGVPLTVGGLFGLLYLFPQMPEELFVFLAFCLVGSSCFLAWYILRELKKRS